MASADIAPDKKGHLYAGIISGVALAHVEFDFKRGFRLVKPTCKNSIKGTLALGIGKEVYDSTGRGTVEGADVAYTVLGGGVACVINRAFYGSW
jgi:hypothetical protein